MAAVFTTVFPEGRIDETDESELKVFYSAVVDGLDPEGNHVEVKTSEGLWNNESFTTKAIYWWTQNKFTKIKYIVVGIKNKRGFVEQLNRIDMEEIKLGYPQWNPNISLRAAQHILNQVKDKYDKVVNPGEMMIIEKKSEEDNISYQIVPVKSLEKHVLTPEFRDKFGKTDPGIEDLLSKLEIKN